MDPQTYAVTVAPESRGKRLDIFLNEFVKSEKIGISRTYLKELIDGGSVEVDGAPAMNCHHKVKEGQRITLAVVPKTAPISGPEDIPLEVVYEDKHLAVINKQPGLVTHPAPGNYAHTLVNALMFRFKKLSDINPGRPGIVHRLDRDTSGIMVIAKDNVTHLALARQFEEQSIKRVYVALVKGRIDFDEDIIEASLDRDPEHRENMAVSFSVNARFAKTRYRVLKRGADFTFVQLEPFTGRTHQLRVHCAYIGHPVLGDRKYGRNNEFPRMALHARTLGFTHPATGKFLEFTSDIPKEFTAYIKKNKAK